MSLRDRRLKEELDELMALNQPSSLIQLIPVYTDDDVPIEYNILYSCKGVVNAAGEVSEEHMVQLYLGAEFPQKPPSAYILTPIFHPNIANLMQKSSFQRRLKEIMERTHDRVQQKEYLRQLYAREDAKKGTICLDILEMDWAAEISLVTVVIQIGEMIQYKLYNATDDFNREASKWARDNSSKLPIDSRDLVPSLRAAKLDADPIHIEITELEN